MAPLRRVGGYLLISLLCLSVAVFYALQGQVRSTSYLVPKRSPLHYVTSKVWCADSSVPAQVLSKELVVRRVYFDPRKRNGYANATVFLLEAKGTTLNGKRFHGCRVGHSFSDRFRFRPPRNYAWTQRNQHATSTLSLIDCFNIPRVENGDSAALYYNTSTGIVVEIHSQKPLFVPEHKTVTTPPAVTAVVCVGMVRTGAHSPSEHGMLYHWLNYQKVIGVDHVHMFAVDNFVRSGGPENDVIQQAIREGYLSIDFWPNWLNTTEVFDSQKLPYQDCLYRFQGVYDYAIYADTDDFFVPVKENKLIKHYLLT